MSHCILFYYVYRREFTIERKKERKEEKWGGRGLYKGKEGNYSNQNLSPRDNEN